LRSDKLFNMQRFLSSGVVFVLLVGFVLSDDTPVDSKVIVLTQTNFDELVTKDSGDWLIEFYAPWCGHCKRLAPIWVDLAHSSPLFKVAKVDCTVEKDLGSRFGVKGFPTIKFFKNGQTEVIDYKGARTLESFTEFVAKTTGGDTEVKQAPSSVPAEEKKPMEAKPIQTKHVETKPVETKPVESTGEAPSEATDVVVLSDATFEEQTKTGTWLVEFYAPWCGHCKRLAPIWEELATAAKSKYHVAKVDCTVEKDIATKQGVRGFPTVKLFIDGVVHDYKGERTVKAFTEFVESKMAK